MSLAHALIRRRRQLVFGALTVLLHLIVFDWFSGQLGRGREVPASAPRAPLQAQIIASPPAVPPAPVSAPQPRFVPPPLPELPPEPVEVADQPPPDAAPDPAPAPDAVADAGAPQDAPAAAAATGAATGAASAAQPAAGVAAGAPAAGSPAAAQAGAATGPQAPPAPATPPPAPGPAQLMPDPRRYKVELPPPADITLDVARVDADGTRWNGEALLAWSRAGQGYSIRVEAGIRVVFARVNLLTLTSEGTLGDDGFAPTLMTEKRRGRSQTATHFNRDAGTLTFSASQAKYALALGAQDKASLPLQLSAIARGDPKQLSGNIDVLVGEDRDASVFTFTVAGQETIATRLGRIATWHLVRPPKPGSYHSRLELWLAPDYGWLPVRIRNVEASGAVTTQTASNIQIKETGKQ